MQTTTHQANGEGIAAAFNHSISHFDAFAKNAAASLKKPVPSSLELTLFERRHLLITGLALTLESFVTDRAHFPVPAAQHVGVHAQITRNMTQPFLEVSMKWNSAEID